MNSSTSAHPYALDVRARTEEISANSHFGPVEHILIPGTATQTAEQVRLFLGSFSHWMTRQDAVRVDLLAAIERLVDDTFGGIVHRPFLTALYTAQRL